MIYLQKIFYWQSATWRSRRESSSSSIRQISDCF